MTLHRLALAAIAATAAASAAAQSQPAVIFDMGGKFDKSFNEAAYNGAEAWKKESGKPYLEFEISNPTQREQAMHLAGSKEKYGFELSLSTKRLDSFWKWLSPS